MLTIPNPFIECGQYGVPLTIPNPFFKACHLGNVVWGAPNINPSKMRTDLALLIAQFPNTDPNI